MIFLGAVSCTKYPTPVPINESYDSTATDTSVVRKVLLITMDGATSSAIQTLKPPHIDSLLAESQYTWDGLSDANTSDASTWASIATGVTSAKHNITDETFLPQVSGPGTVTPFYPTFFYYIKQNIQNSTTLSVSSWKALNDNFFVDATTTITPATDEAVKDSALNHLRTGNETLISVDFRDIEAAGNNGGFSTANTDYKNAIINTDGYIGELLGALNSRSNLAREDWLVIITSNHGAPSTGSGDNPLDERNIFTIFSNPKVKPMQLTANIINAVHFKGDAITTPLGVYGSTSDPGHLYDPQKGVLTIEFKAKFNKNTSTGYSYNWINFIHKGMDNTTGNGWGIYCDHGLEMAVYVKDGVQTTQVDGPTNSFADGLWHSVTVIISQQNGTRNVSLYQDAVLVGSSSVATSGSILTLDNTPLNIGYTGNYFVDVNIANVAFWNTALNAAEIFQHACAMNISTSDPEYSHLVSYWPGQDGGDIFANQISGAPDLTLNGPYQYEISSNTLPCTVSNSSFLVQNVTIAPEIFYWLNIPVQTAWNLDGTSIPLL